MKPGANKIILFHLFGILILGMSSFSPAPAGLRYQGVLGKDFSIHSEIDLGKKGFGKAFRFLKKGEINKCHNSIIDYFLNKSPGYLFEKWPSYDDALYRANNFLSDIYILGIHKGYKLPAKLLWKENPSGSLNWEFNFLALDILRSVSEAYAQTGDERYLVKGEKLIRDFVRNNFNAGALPSRYSWYDHAVAYRTIHSIDFWPNWLKQEKRNRNFVPVMLELTWRHANYLVNNSNYSKTTNHGMFANIALLRIALAFPEFRDAKKWRELAIRRMEDQVRDNFTREGIHKEYSPSYHILTSKLLIRFRKDCRSDRRAMLSMKFKVVLDKIIDIIPYLFHPDGGLALIGDSSESTAKEWLESFPVRNPHLKFVATGGKKGRPPKKESIVFEQARIFVMRSGWGETRSYRDESYLIADYSPCGKAHNHDDFMSFEMCSKGFRWITDLGPYSYKNSDPIRKYIISSTAHNVIIPYKKTDTKTVLRKIPNTEKVKPINMAQLENKIRNLDMVLDPEIKIIICEDILNGNAGRFENRVLLVMALCYDELGTEWKIRECLERIISKGPKNEAYDVAREMLSLHDIDMEDIDFTDVPLERGHGRSLSGRKMEIGEITLMHKPVSITDGRNHSVLSSPVLSKNMDDLLFQMVKPDCKKTPVVDFWISKKNYDYLEGHFSYCSGFEHARGILFVKPAYFLIVDRIRTTKKFRFEQLFHLLPVVDVTDYDKGFLLSVGDSISCIVKCLSSPESVERSVIKGETEPVFQGWYSGEFGNLEPAPVLKYSFNTDEEGTYYIAQLFVPAGTNDVSDYKLEIPGSGTWNIGRGETLDLVILEPGWETGISFLPSTVFLHSANTQTAKKPVIHITRNRKRSYSAGSGRN